MKRYETIYIVNPNLDADSLKEVVAKFSDIIEKLKGYIVKINEWGKKKLAYEVKRFDKGYYILVDFCGLPGTVKELERNLKLDDRILKYLTVKIDEDVDPGDLIGKEDEKEDSIEESNDESFEEE
jgi:small subunit ribosomal protein S6